MNEYEYAAARYAAWIADPLIDGKTKAELRAIAEDRDEIRERFYQDLEFGTGGLRGIIGAGTNRMNRYTVRKATQGMADYIIRRGKAAMGVAIGFDSRHMSPEFALEAALCFCANGIKAYLFESLRPTPELSFAVRYLGCAAGVNVTASHNPPEYNGYKVYWSDGAQVTPPHDRGIMECVRRITDCSMTRSMPAAEALTSGLLVRIGAEVDDAYLEQVKAQILEPESIARRGEALRIVYTPLHGAGNIPVRRVLKELGFPNVYVVPEQEKPDGDFPTVRYPNPEAPAVYALAKQLADRVSADLILATDPDSDRLGVYVRDREGRYHGLTGNETGCLLCRYELDRRSAAGRLPEDAAVISTIVSTALVHAIAADYQVQVIETLTGFKYIGEQIRRFEETGRGSYVFGFEESYGCLLGTYARDKDGVSAAAALCECAAFYSEKNMTLWDAMLDLYETYGYYRDGITSLTLRGFDGKAKMDRIMSDLRAEPPAAIGGHSVRAVRDYRTGIRRDLETGEEIPTGLPVSDVLYYELDGDAWVCVRPSGTEPKIKLYYGIVGKTLQDAENQAKSMAEMLQGLVKKHNI